MSWRECVLIGICFFAAILSALVPGALEAQGINRIISGTVIDPPGVAVAGAAIQAKNCRTCRLLTSKTGETQYA